MVRPLLNAKTESAAQERNPTMRSRRRPGREMSETTKRYAAPQSAPNYRGDEDETLIRVLPLPLRAVDDDEDAFDEMTMRHSSIN